MSKSVINIVLGGCVGALISCGILYPQIIDLQEQSEQATKIIVIDDADLAFSLNDTRATPLQIDNYFKKVKSIKEELVLQGYIVLNADAVSAVDDRNVMTAKDLKELLNDEEAQSTEEQ